MRPISLRPVIGMAFVLCLSLPAVSTGQTTALELRSQEGDFIGGGIDQTFGPADSAFTASRNFDGVEILRNDS